jgi:hypothetical protein
MGFATLYPSYELNRVLYVNIMLTSLADLGGVQLAYFLFRRSK